MPYRYANTKKLSFQVLEILAYIVLLPFGLVAKRTRRPQLPRSVLLIEPFQLGDVVSLSVLLDPLQRALPRAKVYILCKPENQNVFKRDSRVEEVFASEFPWSDYGSKRGNVSRWLTLWKTAKRIRQSHIDIGIDVRGDVRSQIVLAMCGCVYRIGHTNYLDSNVSIKGLLLNGRVERANKAHRYDWNRTVLSALGVQHTEAIHFPSIEFSSIGTIRRRYANRLLILIHVGGGWEYKRWPVQSWAEMIARLANMGLYEIILIGGPKEEASLQAILAQTNGLDVVHCITTTFDEFVAHVAACDVFIGLDSGPANVACCMGKPTLALFGPGDSDMWRPYGTRGRFIHHKDGFPCNPCFQRQCFFSEHNCMASIRVPDVLHELNELVREVHPART